MKTNSKFKQVFPVLVPFLIATALTAFAGCSPKQGKASPDSVLDPLPPSTSVESSSARESMESALLSAAKSGDLPAAIRLLKQGANPSASYTIADTAQASALMIAILYGHTDVANSLIAAGADTHHEILGYTAKDFAIHLGSPEIVTAIETKN